MKLQIIVLSVKRNQKTVSANAGSVMSGCTIVNVKKLNKIVILEKGSRKNENI